MDRLSDLPVKSDTVKTPEEEAIMGQLFPSNNTTTRPPVNNRSVNNEMMQDEDVPDEPKKSKINWKLIGLACVIFVFLANPWVDSLMCKIPYCGSNSISLMGVKLLLFATLLIVSSLFV